MAWKEKKEEEEEAALAISHFGAKDKEWMTS